MLWIIQIHFLHIRLRALECCAAALKAPFTFVKIEAYSQRLQSPVRLLKAEMRRNPHLADHSPSWPATCCATTLNNASLAKIDIFVATKYLRRDSDQQDSPKLTPCANRVKEQCNKLRGKTGHRFYPCPVYKTALGVNRQQQVLDYGPEV